MKISEITRSDYPLNLLEAAASYYCYSASDDLIVSPENAKLLVQIAQSNLPKDIWPLIEYRFRDMLSYRQIKDKTGKSNIPMVIEKYLRRIGRIASRYPEFSRRTIKECTSFECLDNMPVHKLNLSDNTVYVLIQDNFTHVRDLRLRRNKFKSIYSVGPERATEILAALDEAEDTVIKNKKRFEGMNCTECPSLVSCLDPNGNTPFMGDKVMADNVEELCDKLLNTTSPASESEIENSQLCYYVVYAYKSDAFGMAIGSMYRISDVPLLSMTGIQSIAQSLRDELNTEVIILNILKLPGGSSSGKSAQG